MADPLDEQARRIADALHRWMHAAPGRRVVVQENGDGTWTAVLGAETRCNGESMADALAQAATIAATEVTS